jgi:hypothetical protein
MWKVFRLGRVRIAQILFFDDWMPLVFIVLIGYFLSCNSKKIVSINFICFLLMLFIFFQTLIIFLEFSKYSILHWFVSLFYNIFRKLFDFFSFQCAMSIINFYYFLETFLTLFLQFKSIFKLKILSFN